MWHLTTGQMSCWTLGAEKSWFAFLSLEILKTVFTYKEQFVKIVVRKGLNKKVNIFNDCLDILLTTFKDCLDIDKSQLILRHSNRHTRPQLIQPFSANLINFRGWMYGGPWSKFALGSFFQCNMVYGDLIWNLLEKKSNLRNCKKNWV